MISRRAFLKASPLIFAPAIVRADPLMLNDPVINVRTSSGGGGASCGNGSGTEVVTGTSLGTSRNNLTADVGFYFHALSTISVNALGRWIKSGNTQSHTLKLYDDGFSLLGSCTVNTNGATPGAFCYTALNTPITVTSGLFYYILSSETNGGDSWYGVLSGGNSDMTITTTGAISQAGNAQGATVNGTGVFVPVSFKYT